MVAKQPTVCIWCFGKNEKIKRVALCETVKEWDVHKQSVLERDKVLYGVKYGVVRDKTLWIEYEKVMKREREKRDH